MGLIRFIINIPFIFWLIIGGLWIYKDYHDWSSKEEPALKAQIQKKDSELQGFISENKKAAEFEQKKQEKIAEIQKLSAELKKTAESIPRSANMAEILGEIAQITEQLDVEIIDFKPKKLRENNQSSFVKKISSTLKLKGSYVQILSFLNEVSKIKRLVSSQEVTIEKAIKRGSNSFVEATVVIEAFYASAGAGR